MVRIILRQSARNIRHGGLPFFFATLMTAMGMFALALFATVLVNFQRVTDDIGRSIGAVAFLDVKTASDAERTRLALQALDGVSKTTLVPPEVALARVQSSLGDSGSLLDGTAGVRMPWVVEMSVELMSLGARSELIEKASRLKGVDEVLHPGGEVKRIAALGRVLFGAGVFLAVLIGLVLIVVVSNTVKLTLFARRDEIAIMKLVGATDTFVRIPFVVEGLVQGVVGASVALVGLAAAHATFSGWAQVALRDTLGAISLEPLPLSSAVWILVAGACLGALGSLISLGRFLRV